MAFERSKNSNSETISKMERRFRLLAEVASDWFWQTDSQHRYVWFSDNVEQHTGVPASWHLGKSRIELLETATDTMALEAHRATLERREPFSDVEICREGPDGRAWIRSSGTPLFDDDGNFEGYLGTGRNITSLKKSEERIAYMATHDGLTGLSNRSTFEARLIRDCADASSGNGYYCLALVDLDGFKDINDRYGHDAGDRVLCVVAERIAELVDENVDLAARLGGDEFAIQMSQISGRPEAGIVLQELLDRIAEPIPHAGRNLRVGASIGTAFVPADTMEPSDLHKFADLALYEAKSRGRGQVVAYRRKMSVMAETKRRLHCDLAVAVEEKQFSLEFLPVVDLKTNAVLVYEALVRWDHPENGRLLPERFLPAAEEARLLPAIGDIVVEQTLAIAEKLDASWHHDRPAPKFAVNMGFEVDQFESQLQRVQRRLDRLGASDSRLVIDLLETDLFAIETEILANCLKRLCHSGVTIQLDGFGIGSGAFLNLLNLPVDAVKLDRRLVADIGHDERKQAIVRGVIEMCNALGIGVIAKHVETSSQRDWLVDNGCNAAQGFFFGKPITERQLLQNELGQTAR